MKARKGSVTNGSSNLKPNKAVQDLEPSLISDNDFWRPLALTVAANAPSEAIALVMPLLASLQGADRAWIGRYNSELTHFWGVADWVGSGVVSHLQEMQGVSVDVLGGAHQKFLVGENALIPDVDSLPRQYRSLQAELRRESIRSTFAAPLSYGGTLIGFYGFDHVRNVATWTPSDVARLPALGDFLAALLHRSLTLEPPADLPATAERSVHISDPGGMRAIPLEDIVFIKTDGDYSRIHTKNGRHHLERRSLRTWIAQLPRERFLRVHQSYLINGAHIDRLDRGALWTIQLKTIPDPIPVGRAFRHSLRLHMGF
jgi:hypothetical protein